MKKLSSVAVALVFLAFLSTTAFAQTNPVIKQVKAFTTLGQGQGQGINWVDADGDGICDNFGTAKQGTGFRGGKGGGQGTGTGVCDGTGSGLGDGTGVRPQDGTGFGKGNGGGRGTGTGVCDGTGSRGAGRRGNK